MTQPRSILPGRTYLITRRVLRRYKLLRPDPVITNLIIYALAVSAERYGMHIHALCAMSTHLHIVATDQQGVLPRFLQFFHRIVALGTKEIHRWEGPVWDHEPTSAVQLMTPEAVIEKIAYTLANPVAAQIVRRASEWPGAKVLVDELGRGALRAARPAVYVDPNNPMWPDEATLRISLPPSMGDERADDFRQAVAAEVARIEAIAHAEMRDGVVLGASRATTVSPHERATSSEALIARNPTFAVGHGNKDGWQRAVAAVRAFRASYRAALEQWHVGVRSVLFPAGTWWMRVLHAAGVRDMVLAT